MTRTFLPILAGCLLQAAAMAQSPQPEQQGARDKPAAVTAPADDAQQPSAPAPTFTPSEKIGADSAVSFPVDI